MPVCVEEEEEEEEVAVSKLVSNTTHRDPTQL
jgi:hypothetical protein